MMPYGITLLFDSIVAWRSLLRLKSRHLYVTTS